jgi:hypothetical protein
LHHKKSLKEEGNRYLLKETENSTQLEKQEL